MAEYVLEEQNSVMLNFWALRREFLRTWWGECRCRGWGRWWWWRARTRWRQRWSQCSRPNFFPGSAPIFLKWSRWSCWKNWCRWDIWCFSFVEQGKGNVILLNTSVARISNDVLNIYEMWAPAQKLDWRQNERQNQGETKINTISSKQYFKHRRSMSTAFDVA